MANIYSFTNQPVAFSANISSTVSSGNNVTIINSNTASDTPISILQPLQATSSTTQLILGRANSAFNSAFINFYYLEPDYFLNQLTLGINGQSGVTIDGSNNLTVPGLITSSVSTGTNLIVNNSASSGQIPVKFFQENLAYGQTTQIVLGRGDLTNLSGALSYKSDISGDLNLNTISLGLFGPASNTLTINGNRLTTLNGELTVSGTSSFQAVTATTISASGGLTVSSGNLNMNLNTIYLRDTGDINHGLRYNFTPNDGPDLFGVGGGRLLASGTARLSWNTTGVSINGSLTVSSDINYSGTILNSTGGLNTTLANGSKGSFTLRIATGNASQLQIYYNLTLESYPSFPDGNRFYNWLASKNNNTFIRAIGENGRTISFKITSFTGISGSGEAQFDSALYNAVPIATSATSNLWSVTGTSLTLTTVNSGLFSVGMILSGTGIVVNTVITAITVIGGSGSVATLSLSQTNASAQTNVLTGTEPAARCNLWSVTGTTLTLTNVTFGYFYNGMVINAIGITAGTTITAFTVGNGSSGSVATLSISQTTASSQTTLLTGATNIISNGNFSILGAGGIEGDYTITCYPIQDIKTGDILVSNGFVGINTNTPSVALDVIGSGKFTGGLTVTSGTISLNNATSNLINLGAAGISAPTVGTLGSIGQKLVLFQGASNQPPYGFGIDGGTLWASVPSDAIHMWYTGITNTMTLNSSGRLIVSGGLTTSGTSNLQVVTATVVQASGGISVPNSSPSTTATNQGVSIFGSSQFLYGMDLGWNGSYRTRIYAPSNSDIALSTAAESATTQAQFTDRLVVNGTTGAVNISNLTASQAVATNASKNLVSVANTGTGNNVLATSPTLITPVLGAATGTSLQLSGLTASSAVATDASKNLVSVANTGTGNNVLSDTPTFTGVLFAANLNISTLVSITTAAASASLQVINGETYLRRTYVQSDAGGVNMNFRNSSGSGVGSITNNGTTTAYNTTSDYRLKTNVRPIPNVLDTFMKLNPCNFDFISNGFNIDGFIAHELQELLPYAVHGEKDGEDMQTVDYSKLTPLLVATVQEQQKQINLLTEFIKSKFPEF